jgi:hypothetical protein
MYLKPFIPGPKVFLPSLVIGLLLTISTLHANATHAAPTTIIIGSKIIMISNMEYLKHVLRFENAAYPINSHMAPPACP